MSRITAFSEFEMKNASIKFANEESYTKLGCLGSIEESLDVIVVRKKCEGKVVKSRTRGAGSGELKISAHVAYPIYVKAFAMDDSNLKEGVYAFGTDKIYPEFTLVAEVLDEDGKAKMIAYPKCTISTGLANKIENGAEEVAELELTIAVATDENNKVKYEALVEDASETTTNWLTKFDPADMFTV